MKVNEIALAVAVAFSAISVGVSAQAIAVGADGSMQQEKPAAVIAPENQASAEELAKLFDVMRIKQQMRSMKTMIPAMVQQQIQAAVKQTEANLPSSSKLTQEQRDKMQAIMKKYVAKSLDLYPANEMIQDMTAIYQKHLSKDDVEGLIAFYSSPAGQHLLDAQPVIAQEYMPTVMAKVGQRSQEMARDMMKEMAEVVPQSKPAAKAPTKAGTAKTAPK